jgi:RNase P/RNase MRP subunit POP5
MVVKSKRGRRRYIAIKSKKEGTMSDEDLLSVLNSSLAKVGIKFKLIQFDGRQGIVRVSGDDQKKAVDAINHEGSMLETLRASGTLRTLREGVLSPGKQ